MPECRRSWLAVIGVLPATVWGHTPWPWLENWHWFLTGLAVAATAGIHKIVAATFGRVVRYTRADPDNIAARAAVRERGLALLRALHQGKGYERIVVVSHSLGTILAHDLLSYFWAEREAARCIREDSPDFETLAALEKAAARISEPNPEAKHFDAYFAAQRKLRLALARRPAPDSAHPKLQDRRWLVSDFVTFGSPLAHAEFLLASDRGDFESRKAARELPESPPYRELLDPEPLVCAERTQRLPIAKPREQSRLISFPIPPAYQVWELHYAAPFAVVRWTNIYDPAKLAFFGDVIGGPLANVFGPAIIDVDLRRLRGRQSLSFTHTKYWSIDGEPVHIEALRRAVNLLDRADSGAS